MSLITTGIYSTKQLAWPTANRPEPPAAAALAVDAHTQSCMLPWGVYSDVSAPESLMARRRRSSAALVVPEGGLLKENSGLWATPRWAGRAPAWAVGVRASMVVLHMQ